MEARFFVSCTKVLGNDPNRPFNGANLASVFKKASFWLSFLSFGVSFSNTRFGFEETTPFLKGFRAGQDGFAVQNPGYGVSYFGQSQILFVVWNQACFKIK